MNIDIYIKERNGSREIRIPWLPEEIEYESGGTTVATYDIMNKGEVAVPTGSGLAAVSWQGIFPGKNRTDSSMLRGSWKDPKTYHNLLEDWRKNGEPLNLMVTGYPINLDVILEKYTGTASGGFGDLSYQLSFLEDREITIGATKVSNNAGGSSSTKRAAKEDSTYTIKKGDTLWGISKRMYGSSAKWKTIYNANKEIIDSTAKKRWKAVGINRGSQNGYWIFPGTVITIPR